MSPDTTHTVKRAVFRALEERFGAKSVKAEVFKGRVAVQVTTGPDVILTFRLFIHWGINWTGESNRFLGNAEYRELGLKAGEVAQSLLAWAIEKDSLVRLGAPL